jgi:antitoxin component YwqK of YwqJK toxin-antitoxin module
MREQTLVDGDPHGRTVVYDQRGRVVQEMNYRNGRLHGTMTFYDRSGKPTKTTEYEDGQVRKAAPAGVPKGAPQPAQVPGGRR